MRNAFIAPFMVLSVVTASGCENDSYDLGTLLLTIDDGVLYPAGWSDDSAFVFATLHQGESWRIARINAANGHYTLLDVGLERAGVGDVHGNKLALESVEDGGSDIYVFDQNTEALVQVTDSSRYEWHPTFRPDGAAIAYDVSTKIGPDIYLQNLSGGTPVRITDHPESEQASQFSPNGKQIAFHRRVNGSDDNYDMIIRDLESGTERAFANTKENDSYPNWSPKGDRIVFSSNRTGEFNLFIVCTQSDGVQQLTYGSGNEKYPKWSPDGRSILYQSDSDSKKALYLIDAPTSLTCA